MFGGQGGGAIGNKPCWLVLSFTPLIHLRLGFWEVRDLDHGWLGRGGRHLLQIISWCVGRFSWQSVLGMMTGFGLFTSEIIACMIIVTLD